MLGGKKDAPYTYDKERHWAELVTNTDDEPWDGQEVKIVLTSSHTYLSRVETTLIPPKQDPKLPKLPKTPIFCPGWIIRDEFTTDKAVTARTCRIMVKLNKQYPESKPFFDNYA